MDIDECLSGRKCSQTCKNTEGSYSCSCQPGFTLDPENNQECVFDEKSETPVYLLISERESLSRFTLEDGDSNLLNVNTKRKFNSLPNGNYQINSMAYHYERNKLFYADAKTRKIYFVPLEESFRKIVKHDVPAPPKPILNVMSKGLAVDYIYDKLYFTTEEKTIEVSELNGDNRHILHQKNVEKPDAIAVAPEENLIFWTDQAGNNPRIESSQLNGEGRAVIVTVDSANQIHTSLTLDLNKKRLYYSVITWTMGAETVIESCEFNGEKRYKLISKSSKLRAIQAMANFNGRIFIAENGGMNGQHVVQSGNINSGAGVKKIFVTAHSLL